MILNDQSKNMAWDVFPLSLVSREQQIKFKDRAETRSYILGEIIWATDSPQGIVGSDNGAKAKRSGS